MITLHTIQRTGLSALLAICVCAAVSTGCGHRPRPAARTEGPGYLAPRAPRVATNGGLGAVRPGRVPGSTSGALNQPPVPSATAEDLSRLHANELGFIPVLMYHAIGGPAIGNRPRYDRHGLNIRPETFKKQLEMMYRAGWYPVNVRDLVSPSLNVPAGRIPVALTFDDARGSQFRYLKDGSIDPLCAVGILLSFHRKHPDWPLRGTFYVMGRSRWNPVPFYQPGLDGKKLRWLVDHGFEIGNHSTSHRLFSLLDPATERWEIGECKRYVTQRAPAATMDTFALPGGGKPRSHAGWEALMYGKACGMVYHHKAVLLAWGGPAPSPARRDFDRWRIPRIGAEPGNIEYWIRHLTSRSRTPAYVSDGVSDIVSAPRAYAAAVAKRLPPSVRFVAYGPQPGRVSGPPAGPARAAWGIKGR